MNGAAPPDRLAVQVQCGNLACTARSSPTNVLPESVAGGTIGSLNQSLNSWFAVAWRPNDAIGAETRVRR